MVVRLLGIDDCLLSTRSRVLRSLYLPVSMESLGFRVVVDGYKILSLVVHSRPRS